MSRGNHPSRRLARTWSLGLRRFSFSRDPTPKDSGPNRIVVNASSTHEEESGKTYGIQELYRPTHTEPEIDIVAIHGLNGDAQKTWTAKNREISWLCHPEFLPKYLPNARILTWGYNASFSSILGDCPSKDRIHHHAQTLVANLAADRRLAGTADKPIIFLCHSLGGIVVKRALSYAQTRTGHKISHDYSIFSCTYGVLFFGTPHHGSNKATWLSYLMKTGAMTGLSHSKSDLVSALEYESETLQNITDYFVPIMRHFRIYYFWEQKQTDLKMLGKGYIVSQESAAPTHDETERAGINADHSGMVKFDDASGQGFRMVLDALLRYAADAPAAIQWRREEAECTLLQSRQSESVGILSSAGMKETSLLDVHDQPSPWKLQRSKTTSHAVRSGSLKGKGKLSPPSPRLLSNGTWSSSSATIVE